MKGCDERFVDALMRAPQIKGKTKNRNKRYDKWKEYREIEKLWNR